MSKLVLVRGRADFVAYRWPSHGARSFRRLRRYLVSKGKRVELKAATLDSAQYAQFGTNSPGVTFAHLSDKADVLLFSIVNDVGSYIFSCVNLQAPWEGHREILARDRVRRRPGSLLADFRLSFRNELNYNDL